MTNMNSRFVRRVGAINMFRAGLWIQFVMAIWLVLSAFLGVGFWALVVGVAAFVGCVSTVSSNAMAVILDEFPHMAGTASSLAGTFRFGIGAVVGALLSMADKADTLAGCFGLGMIPTGAADPNGLRRCALGIIRIMLEFGLAVDVRQFFAKAQQLYGDRQWKLAPHDALDKLMEFFAARLRNYFMSQGQDTLLVDAALGAGAEDVKDCGARLEALAAFSQAADYEAAVQTFKRVANILRKQGQAEELSDHWDPALLREDAEKALASTLEEMLPRLDALWAAHDHAAALACLSAVRPAVDAFFAGVMVMCDDADLRRNRLSMLRGLGSRFARLADFSALQM